MKVHSRNRFCLAVLCFIWMGFNGYTDDNVVKNPSFEEDVDNIGLPDHWKVPKDVNECRIDDSTHGNRAVEFNTGYVILSQNLSIDNLAGKTIYFQCDARGTDDAQLGVRIGYFIKDSNGRKKWVSSTLLWKYKLTNNYKTVLCNRAIPENRIGQRFWFAIYRSNQKGTIAVDNVIIRIGNLKLEEKRTLNQLGREWNYLKNRAESIQGRVADNTKIKDLIQEAGKISEECIAQNANCLQYLKKSDQLKKRLGEYSSEIRQIAFPGKKMLVSFANPYTRLIPWQLPSEKSLDKFDIFSLLGEYQAVGVVLSNCSSSEMPCRISLSGIREKEFCVEMRQQEFLETWYKKDKERVADPLPLLPKEGNDWLITLKPGETKKVYIGLKIPETIKTDVKSIGNEYLFDATVNVKVTGYDSWKGKLCLHVIPTMIHKTPRFEYFACVYPDRACSHEATANDMVTHGVTIMEFPYPPQVVFTPEGKIASVDFSRHDPWLKAYGNKIRLAIFWAKCWLKKFKTTDGGNLEPYSGAWKNAYANLLKAFLNHASEMGIKQNRFIIWPWDELHSECLEKSPDQTVDNAITICKLVKQCLPELPILMTFGNYSFPNDIQAAAPYVDIYVPHWSLPDRLGKLAPPSYNPNQSFFAKSLPILEKQRQTHNKKILSYHVSKGKSDEVIKDCLAYPIIAIGLGFTGAGSWAYNVTNSSSWDDTDGKGVDYSFVYNGLEKHPVNTRLNPMKEVVVPSIRWQAMRSGLQDAQLLLGLKEILKDKKLSSVVREKIEKLLKTVEQFANEYKTRNNKKIEPEFLLDLSKKIRQLYLHRNP